MAERKKPLRQCAGCMQMKEKKDLLRIVKRNDDGRIVPDPSGKIQGRGCYLCRTRDCMEQAKKNRGLSRSFKCSIPEETWDLITQTIS